ncbi:PDR/VanB family oxidoreductase [Marinomonas algicola]|uniref:PDR/VanB family oxidoreductase n=1 Tax=Marinomonas algicola TaxID=2773454 RepID=UPI001747F45C|nr:PDR/VanB family oxidoreductase [Marinomonas algicola]
MLDVIILSKTQETADIISFELGKSDGSALPAFEAGSHIDVQVNAKLVRQYSLYNAPKNHQTYKIAVLKDANSRGGSSAVHDTFEVGDTIQISSPRNLFPLKNNSNKTLLFAGGIGITPLLSMAQVLNELEQNFELHYFSRSKSHTAFFDDLSNSPFAEQVFFHFSDERDDKDRVVKQALSQEGALNKDSHLYTCGPNGFMDYIFGSAKALGWSEENLHKEVFNAAPIELDDSDKAFTLELVRSGIHLEIPADKTVLEVLEDADIELDSSCEQGVCGSCITKVISGTPDHRDQFLTDIEKSLNDQFTPCCSRALTDSLSIDL